MTPIERVSEKSRAFAILGVPRECTKSDLKSAYRQLAREKHPDQESGSADEFSRITNAYQYLQENADEFGISDESVAKVAPRMARPTVRATETTFAEDILSECRAELDTSDLEARHLSTHLHRTGRKLTYFVPSAPQSGENVVVVPTGELVDTRHAHPKLVVLEGRHVFGGVYDVPEAVCAEVFPGARSVCIRFAD